LNIEPDGAEQMRSEQAAERTADNQCAATGHRLPLDVGERIFELPGP
jgi:hypothetical protein